MKTFAQSEGEENINWHEVLERGIAGTLTVEERITYGVKANGWVTCACGNQCALLPRNEDGEPEDEQLSELGMDFMYAIHDENYEKALQTLNRIERRANDLIQELSTK